MTKSSSKCDTLYIQNVDKNLSENKQAAVGPFFLSDKLSIVEVSLPTLLHRFQLCFKERISI